MKANPKTFKYLSFPKFYLSFLKAYVVKFSEKPGFWDYFHLSFLKIGEKLSFFRPEFFWERAKKSLIYHGRSTQKVSLIVKVRTTHEVCLETNSERGALSCLYRDSFGGRSHREELLYRTSSNNVGISGPL